MRPKRLIEVSGVLGAAHYVAVKGGPKHLVMVELDDHRVFHESGFLDAFRIASRAETSPARVGRNHILNGYRLIFPSRTDPVGSDRAMPGCIMMGRMDIPSFLEEEFNAWYNTVYIPDYLAVPGCLGARRFVAVEGQPKYLTVYELESPAVQASDAWLRARTGNPWTARLVPFMKLDEGSPAIFQRRYPE